MNNRIFFISSLFALVLLTGLDITLGDRLVQSFSTRLHHEVEIAFQTQVTVLSDLIRNDLLSGNFREARNKLARGTVRSRIVGCVAKPNGGAAEILVGPANIGTDARYESVTVPIFFGTDSPAWGDLTYFIDHSSLNQSVHELEGILRTNQLITTIILILVCLIILYFLWNSAQFLQNRFAFILGGGGTTFREGVMSRFWRPIVNKFSEIGMQYQAVNHLINEIENKNEQASHLSQVVHDLKSPLSAIKLAQGKLPSSEASNLIGSAANRIEKLIESSIAHKKEGVQPLSSGVDVNPLSPLLQNLLPELLAQDPRAKIDLHIEPDAVACQAAIDVLQLQSIISNIVKNAIEADTSGASKINILVKATKKIVYIIVADAGPGMPDEVLRQIGQVPITHNKATHSTSGTGQGLYSAFRIIRSWGGETRISSQLGHGTQIVMGLPRVS